MTLLEVKMQKYLVMSAQLQVKLQETREIIYLKARKEQTSALVTYLEVSKKEKR